MALASRWRSQRHQGWPVLARQVPRSKETAHASHQLPIRRLGCSHQPRYRAGDAVAFAAGAVSMMIGTSSHDQEAAHWMPSIPAHDIEDDEVRVLFAGALRTSSPRLAVSTVSPSRFRRGRGDSSDFSLDDQDFEREGAAAP